MGESRLPLFKHLIPRTRETSDAQKTLPRPLTPLLRRRVYRPPHGKGCWKLLVMFLIVCQSTKARGIRQRRFRLEMALSGLLSVLSSSWVFLRRVRRCCHELKRCLLHGEAAVCEMECVLGDVFNLQVMLAISFSGNVV